MLFTLWMLDGENPGDGNFRPYAFYFGNAGGYVGGAKSCVEYALWTTSATKGQPFGRQSFRRADRLPGGN